MSWRRPEGDLGAGLLEYVLMVSLIAMVAFVGVSLFGESLAALFDRAASSIP